MQDPAQNDMQTPRIRLSLALLPHLVDQGLPTLPERHLLRLSRVHHHIRRHICSLQHRPDYCLDNREPYAAGSDARQPVLPCRFQSSMWGIDVDVVELGGPGPKRWGSEFNDIHIDTPHRTFETAWKHRLT